jgi:fructose-1,6-bisphosphatase I
MRLCPVALYASRELDNPVVLNADARLAVACDPLAGSSEIDANGSIATIFSIVSVSDEAKGDLHQAFLQPGRNQHAAGFVIYGPQLALALTLGSGTHIFTFSKRLGVFVQTHESRVIPPRAHDIAIEGSNYRFWHEPVRLYIDDCLKGVEGPREREFQLRWTGFAIAETFRILVRGGIFLDPADFRQGSSRGHLNLVFEANPIALLVEQAGGAATDTVREILDLIPESLIQKTPVIFGSSREVARVARYHTEPSMIADRSPLFGTRGLFRA